MCYLVGRVSTCQHWTVMNIQNQPCVNSPLICLFLGNNYKIGGIFITKKKKNRNIRWCFSETPEKYFFFVLLFCILILVNEKRIFQKGNRLINSPGENYLQERMFILTEWNQFKVVDVKLTNLTNKSFWQLLTSVE